MKNHYHLIVATFMTISTVLGQDPIGSYPGADPLGTGPSYPINPPPLPDPDTARLSLWDQYTETSHEWTMSAFDLPDVDKACWQGSCYHLKTDGVCEKVLAYQKAWQAALRAELVKFESFKLQVVAEAERQITRNYGIITSLERLKDKLDSEMLFPWHRWRIGIKYYGTRFLAASIGRGNPSDEWFNVSFSISF